MSRRKYLDPSKCCTERVYGRGAWARHTCSNRAIHDGATKCGVHSKDAKAARKKKRDDYWREKGKVREARERRYDARQAREEARVELVDAVGKMLGKPGSLWCGDRNRLTALVGRCRE